jgi:peptidoglycan/LPS O-acetylase OafA/YrhL
LSTDKKYFANLDGLRFILAVVVFAMHSLLGKTLDQVIHFDFLQRLIKVFSSGDLGVSFFFVLSGFLITYLMFEEKESTKEFSLTNFYIRRSFRIWPLYFCVLGFSFFVYPLLKTGFGHLDQNPFRLLYQAFFLANFDNIFVQHHHLVHVAPMMVSINWSVSIEEQFYLLWPLIFLSIPPRKFWIVCLLLILLSWVFRIYYYHDGAILYYHTLSVVSDLAIGGLGAYLSFYNVSFLMILKELNRSIIVFVYCIGFMLLIYHDRWFDTFFIHTTFRNIQAMFFCFIILEQNNCDRSFFKMGNSRRLSSLGKYTYALYMLHPIGIQFAIIFFRYAGLAQDQSFYFSMLYVGISFFVSLSLSIFSYFLLERHFLRWRSLFYR